MHLEIMINVRLPYTQWTIFNNVTNDNNSQTMINFQRQFINNIEDNELLTTPKQVKLP